MIGSRLLLDFFAGSFTEASPLPIRAVLDVGWAENGVLLKGMSSSSVLVRLSAKIGFISGTGLNFGVYRRTQLLRQHEFALLCYLE